MSDDDETWARFGSAPAPASGLQWDADAVHPFETPEPDRYVRQRELGRGGMGLVLSVLDQRLGRSVALKETRTDSPEAAARLAREAAITARLQHPGIVPVYDAGQTGAGRLFYTLRLVEGRALREELTERDSLEARLPLLRPYLAVCHAIAYAHEQGVLHRDLKPDNVMLGARGETLVVDWGLACTLDEAAPIGPLPTGIRHETRAGAVMGTPGYMSPEQASGGAVGVRSDVWSLGCILYEILAGQPPFVGGDAPSILRRVLAGEHPPLDPERVPSALIAVAERAMAADPADRYPSADALADDVARYLDGRLVAAHSYTPVEQLQYLARRWRAPLAVAAVAAAVLVAGAVGAGQRIVSERARALDAEAQAIVAREQSDGHLQRALIAQASLAQLSGDRAKSETLAAHALGLGDQPRARGVLAASSLQSRPRLVSVSAPLPCDEVDLSRGGGRLLCVEDGGVSVWDGTPLARRWRQPLPASGALFFDDDRSIIVEVEGSTDVILDARDGADVARTSIDDAPSLQLVSSAESSQIFSFSDHHFTWLAPIRRQSPRSLGCGGLIVSLSPHNETIALLCLGQGVLWAPEQEATPIQSELLSDYARYSVAPLSRFSPSGRYLLLGTLEGWLELLSVSPTRETQSLAVQHVGQNALLALAFSPDEKTVAFIREDGQVGIWTPDTGLLLMLPSVDAQSIAFDGDDLLIAGRELRRWRLPPDRRPVRFRSVGGVSAAAISPDGAMIAAAQSPSSAAAWSLRDGRKRFQLPFQSRNVTKDVTFSIDSTVMLALSAGAVPPVRVDVETGTVLTELPEPMHGGRRILALQDGLVAVLGWRGLQLWQDGAMLNSVSMSSQNFADGEVTPDGATAAMVTATGDFYLLHARPQPRVERLISVPGVRTVDLSADGAMLAWSDGEQLSLAPTASPDEQRHIPRDERTTDLALSPNGKWLAASGYNDVTVYDVDSGKVLAVLDGHAERVVSVDFSNDSRVLISGGWDGLVQLWGTDALERSPQEMLDEIEAAWQLSLAEALSR